MVRKKDAFFNATQDALDKLTQMYDLVWPIDVSLRYMRKKVTEFYTKFPDDLKPEDFENEFDPDKKTHGVNYTRAFVYTGKNASELLKNESALESAQQENLAWLLLTNTIPIYEHWWKSLSDEVGFSTMSEAGMEFPTNPLDSRKKGILQELSSINSNISSLFTDVFYPVYTSKKNHCIDINELNSSMYCYRLFKEIRNCYMHSGGFVSDTIKDSSTNLPWITVAYNEYLANIVTPSSTNTILNIEELPSFPSNFSTNIGDKLHITLRGVVGFSNIMRRIMLTVDAELIKSQITEQYIVNKWNQFSINSDQKFEMPISKDAINYLRKYLNGDSISNDEKDNFEKNFNKRLRSSQAKYEYNCMIKLLNSVNLLVPHEMSSYMNSELESVIANYKNSLIHTLLPYLKTINLVDTSFI